MPTQRCSQISPLGRVSDGGEGLIDATLGDAVRDGERERSLGAEPRVDERRGRGFAAQRDDAKIRKRLGAEWGGHRAEHGRGGGDVRRGGRAETRAEVREDVRAGRRRDDAPRRPRGEKIAEGGIERVRRRHQHHVPGGHAVRGVLRLAVMRQRGARREASFRSTGAPGREKHVRERFRVVVPERGVERFRFGFGNLRRDGKLRRFDDDELVVAAGKRARRFEKTNRRGWVPSRVDDDGGASRVFEDGGETRGRVGGRERRDGASRDGDGELRGGEFGALIDQHADDVRAVRRELERREGRGFDAGWGNRAERRESLGGGERARPQLRVRPLDAKVGMGRGGGEP